MNHMKPWPLDLMLEWYQKGHTHKEIAARLSSAEWQPYWIEKIGREYHPDRRTVNRAMTYHSDYDGRVGKASMEKNNFWKSGRYTDNRGYVYIRCPDHPNGAGAGGGYVQEHRLVMENHLGRILTKEEVVHHIDGNRGNNHIDNLMLFPTNAAHLAHELKGRQPRWSEAGKQRLREAVSKPRKKREQDARSLLEMLHR